MEIHVHALAAKLDSFHGEAEPLLRSSFAA